MARPLHRRRETFLKAMGACGEDRDVN